MNLLSNDLSTLKESLKQISVLELPSALQRPEEAKDNS
jgi:hypothetical protein